MQFGPMGAHETQWAERFPHSGTRSDAWLGVAASGGASGGVVKYKGACRKPLLMENTPDYCPQFR